MADDRAPCNGAVTDSWRPLVLPPEHVITAIDGNVLFGVARGIGNEEIEDEVTFEYVSRLVMVGLVIGVVAIARVRLVAPPAAPQSAAGLPASFIW
jgi:hypothetical protein